MVTSSQRWSRHHLFSLSHSETGAVKIKTHGSTWLTWITYLDFKTENWTEKRQVCRNVPRFHCTSVCVESGKTRGSMTERSWSRSYRIMNSLKSRVVCEHTKSSLCLCLTTQNQDDCCRQTRKWPASIPGDSWGVDRSRLLQTDRQIEGQVDW